MGYAEGTSVSVDRTQGEIRRVLEKYKAEGFAFAEEQAKSTVMFMMKGRKVRFIVKVPQAGDKKPGKQFIKMTKENCAQETRRLWRCLLLSIKSKLECVESGISTFEDEFLSHIVLPNGQTMGEYAIPQIESVYKGGQMPLLLEGPRD